VSTVRERLLRGDVLRILFGENVGFDVWVEKYANPPRVFFEGKPHPLDEFDTVLDRVNDYLSDETVRSRWTGTGPAG